MNLKKILVCLTTIIVFAVFVTIQGTSYATQVTSGQERYMGIIRFMTHHDPHMGYAINIPGTGTSGSDGANSGVIWNIVKYKTSNKSSGFEDGNYYCLRAGLGFRDVNGNLAMNEPFPYDVYYNMKTERQGDSTKKTVGIKEQNETLKKLVEGTITDQGNSISVYNAVLATLDNMYLPAKSNAEDSEKASAEQAKKELICELIQYAKSNYASYVYNMAKAFDYSKLGVGVDEFVTNRLTQETCKNYDLTEYALTDDDIIAVQQAVLWYFTNHDEAKYNKTGDKKWLSYVLETDPSTSYKGLYTYGAETTGAENAPGLVRDYQAEVLYNYMIQQAKTNAKNYENSSSTLGAPAKVDTTTLNRELSGNNYIIGPIHISSLNSKPYTIDFTVTDNGTAISNYQLLDENKTKLPEGTTIKSRVGKDFYLSVPKSQVHSLKVKIAINYSDTNMTLWASTKNNEEQPIVEVEKAKQPPVEWEAEVKPIPEEPEPEPETAFDLKLIKRITAVNNQNVPERIEKVDVSKLNISGANRKTTAEYTLNKEPIGVAKGDIVTYTFRIYNEGTLDGYAEEITEDVPEGLQFIWSEKTGEELKADTTLTAEEKEAIEFNQKYLWGKFVYDDKKENITQISSDYLSKANESTAGDNLIKAFGENDGKKTEKDLSFKELSVKFKVIAENKAGTIIRNEAAITEDADKDGKPVKDRDSDTDKWVKYEDDEDYDNIILQSFDLALRKFIIAISNDTKIENNEYLKNQDGSYTRAPIVDTSKLNTKDESGKLITTATYNHTKEPILVKPNDIVVYMLRVYNEGDIDGYAAEIKDHLPPYLEYVDDEFNKQYGWEVSEDGRTVTTKYLDNSLITKAQEQNGKIVLSYKEVPIMCKVKENAKSGENITNIADITKYLDKDKKPAVDRDSQENNVKLPEDKNLPNYKENEKGSYVPGQQDDDDFEKVNIKIFDLALRKWVTQAIVIENGKQTVTQTGHDAWDDPEAVVKVELHRKKLNQVTVKFRYSIRVYNQGEIEGYAKEITDYVPEGLKFVAEDNKGWTDEGNNVISTRLLENTLLQPGEYADVEVLLTWINNENNMGVMNNTAEISEDYNEYGVPDIDSTPDNKKAGEDDIDDAPVMLSISTGQMRIYFTLGFIILVTTASGIILIKKFVL